MARTISRKKRITITAIVTGALVLAGGGAAFAYWTAQGTGTGTATTGTTTAFTVAQDSISGPILTPGTGTQIVVVKVTNPSTTTKETFSTLTAAVAFPSTVTSCAAADYAVTVPPFTATNLAAGASTTVNVTISMNETNVNQDGCKGISVPLAFAAS